MEGFGEAITMAVIITLLILTATTLSRVIDQRKARHDR